MEYINLLHAADAGDYSGLLLFAYFCGDLE